MSETKMIIVRGEEIPIVPCEQKLPPELKAKWLEALCSGKYKQTQQQLKCGDGYCCLGVLSHIQGRLALVGDNATDGLASDGSTLCLASDNPVRFVDDHRVARYGDISCCLSALNDRGATFEEIANIIEYAF